MRTTLMTLCLLGAAVPLKLDAAPECVSIPASSPNAAVHVCEQAESYEFEIAGDVLRFHKEVFQTRINSAIGDWWQSHHFSFKDLRDAHIQIWLSVPEANPSATQARAIVKTPSGNISLSFDLYQSSWAMSDDQAAVLGVKSYPETFGWRPHQLMIKVVPGTKFSDLERLAAGAHVTMGEECSPGWFRATSTMFDEAPAVRRLMELDQQGAVFKDVQVNSLMEWIALRGQAFAFTWTAPSEMTPVQK